jgi:hypothetical protein
MLSDHRDLSVETNVEVAIRTLCAGMAVGGLRLISTLVYQTQLILIFQSEPSPMMYVEACGREQGRLC